MYGKSSKIVNLVIQSLIAVGAGILGIWFTVKSCQYYIYSPSNPFELHASLAVLGLTLMILAILGIVFLSISLKTENNRYEWINYILYGSMVLVLGAYTLSNGTIYPYFFSKDAFPVVFFSILGVIILGVGIGVIVNSFKDEKDKRYSLLPLILPLAVANFSIFLVDILTVLTFPSSYGNRETALLQLNLASIFALVTLIISVIGGLMLYRYLRRETNKNEVFIAFFVLSLALITFGVGTILYGYTEYLQPSSQQDVASNICHFVFGGIMCLVGLFFTVLSFTPYAKKFKNGVTKVKKKREEKHEQA